MLKKIYLVLYLSIVVFLAGCASGSTSIKVVIEPRPKVFYPWGHDYYMGGQFQVGNEKLVEEVLPFPIVVDKQITKINKIKIEGSIPDITCKLEDTPIATKLEDDVYLYDLMLIINTGYFYQQLTLNSITFTFNDEEVKLPLNIVINHNITFIAKNLEVNTFNLSNTIIDSEYLESYYEIGWSGLHNSIVSLDKFNHPLYQIEEISYIDAQYPETLENKFSQFQPVTFPLALNQGKEYYLKVKFKIVNERSFLYSTLSFLEFGTEDSVHYTVNTNTLGFQGHEVGKELYNYSFNTLNYNDILL